jgi:hypothetical protein
VNYDIAVPSIPHGNRRIGRHSDVIVHGVGSILPQMKPALFFRRINGSNAYSFAGLLYFDLNFLGKGFCILARPGLHADGGGDLDVAARFSVEFDFAEFVLNVD